MKAIEFVLELEDAAALTAFAATVGNHETLTYIPGACVMGYLAGRLYKDLEDSDARRLFHSDQVRFGDARLLSANGQPACPSPKSWFYAKHLGKPLSGPDDDQLVRERLLDARLDVRNPRLRYKAFAGGELCIETGRLISPRRSFRQATAIDADRNRAAEGQLFGYEGLEPGQHFGGQILFASEIPETLYQRVLEQLEQASFFIGRSRSAQYGRVRCRAVAANPPLPPSPATDNVALWMMSDLAVWDDQGQPSLWPHAEWLGLPSGRLVPEQTFLATRRYSSWNGYARSRDRERLVITRGSLLTFQIEDTWTDAHRERLALGLGGYLAHGLGETRIYPSHWDWPASGDLNGDHAAPRRRIPNPVDDGVSVQPAAGDRYARELLDWLGATAQSDADRLESALSELKECYAAYRRLNGLTEVDQNGPRKTHWAEVERIATAGVYVRRRLEALPRVWRESRYGENATDHFAHWVLQWADQPELLARLATEARRRNIMGEQS